MFISTAGGWGSGGGHAVRTRKEDREGKAWKTREVEGRKVEGRGWGGK